MVDSCRWFTNQRILALKLLSAYVHRSTLPQSRIRSTAPSEREPGWGAYRSTGYSLKSRVAGDFHRPYETQKFLHFTIQCTARKTEGAGDFHCTGGGSEVFTFHHLVGVGITYLGGW